MAEAAGGRRPLGPVPGAVGRGLGCRRRGLPVTREEEEATGQILRGAGPARPESGRRSPALRAARARGSGRRRAVRRGVAAVARRGRCFRSSGLPGPPASLCLPRSAGLLGLTCCWRKGSVRLSRPNRMRCAFRPQMSFSRVESAPCRRK